MVDRWALLMVGNSDVTWDALAAARKADPMVAHWGKLKVELKVEMWASRTEKMMAIALELLMEKKLVQHWE